MTLPGVNLVLPFIKKLLKAFLMKILYCTTNTNTNTLLDDTISWNHHLSYTCPRISRNTEKDDRYMGNSITYTLYCVVQLFIWLHSMRRLMLS